MRRERRDRGIAADRRRVTPERAGGRHGQADQDRGHDDRQPGSEPRRDQRRQSRACQAGRAVGHRVERRGAGQLWAGHEAGQLRRPAARHRRVEEPGGQRDRRDERHGQVAHRGRDGDDAERVRRQRRGEHPVRAAAAVEQGTEHRTARGAGDGHAGQQLGPGRRPAGDGEAEQQQRGT